MSFFDSFKKQSVRNAFMLGTLCSVSYLGVYFARNVLSATTPHIVENTAYTAEYIGGVSSLYFIFYAVGQLINGFIGDRIKARYMMSFGLILAGICNMAFPYFIDSPTTVKLIYGMTGFFLAMIYAPMTKVVAENTEPHHATRCSLGYTFASFFGSPMAGLIASLLAWQAVFATSTVILAAMGIICFFVFLFFEKKGIVKYGQYKHEPTKGGGIKVLIDHHIIKFTLIAVITGVIRTSTVFWLPTYFAQHLNFSSTNATMIYTAATLVISATTFVAVFIYERLGRNMDLTIFASFIISALLFLAAVFIGAPTLNIIITVLAIMANNCAATMLWSRYCPSLRDTGMVSGATGFLDFMGYMSAAVANVIFPTVSARFGWHPLIVSWFVLMALGIAVSIPKKSKGVKVPE